jgi:putative ABC transport system permease protein
MNIFELKEAILMALESIRANKFRAFLTILGVLIGVGAVIAMVSLIEGLNAAVAADIESLGSNVIFVSKYAPNTDYHELTDEQRRRKPITIDDADVIRERCPDVAGVSPQNYYFRPGGNLVKYGNVSANSPNVFGTSVDYEKVNNFYIEHGRFFTPTEDYRKIDVCVIGSEVADKLFAGVDPIGKNILVNNVRMLVIGVMSERSQNLGGRNENNFVILPYGTFHKHYPWEKELFLAVSARSTEVMQKAEDEIREALRRSRGVRYNQEDNFALFTQASIMEMYNDITSGIWLAMIAISSIGLMVGGIGVLNIMLVSVTERTREIGIRKAIGARRVNIFFQFLTEAMTLSGTGGLIGIVGGLALSFLISVISPLPMIVPILWIFIGFAVGVSVGLISGIVPAVRAASVDPIVSLRYE